MSAGAVWATITPVEPTSAGAKALADAMTASESLVTDAAFETVPTSELAAAHGTSDAGLNAFPTNGSTFAILTTGDVNLADDPNESDGDGVGLGGPAIRGDTDRDVTILKVNIDVPPGANCLRVDFKFLSEEFAEFVGSDVNDAFIAELDASTWTTLGSEISAPDNFAFDPSGAVISVNTSGSTSMSLAEAAGTTYDGATPLLTASTQVTPGAHALFLSIFDQGDDVYDSAVFVDNLAVSTVVNPETECAKGATRFGLGLSPATSTNPVGTEHTVTATLTDEGGALPEASIGFSVTGANPSAGWQWKVTQSDGTAPFKYTGLETGDDTIVACYDADRDELCDETELRAFAKKTWTAVEAPDLVVTKSDSADPVQVGDALTYTITVANEGDAPAAGVHLEDQVPDGVTVGEFGSSQGSCNIDGSVFCDLGTIGVGESVTVTILVTPDTPGELSNTVTVTTDAGELTLDNNTATETTVVNPAVSAFELALTPASAENPVGTPHEVTATLTEGGVDKQGATITFTVTGANATTGTGVTNSDGRATFSYTGSNAGNDTIVACYDSDENGSCGEGDTVASATKTWTPVELPDLVVAKSDSPDSVQVGATLTYTITVANQGGAPAADVHVTDELPTGVTFSTVNPSQGMCTGTTSIACALGAIEPDAGAIVTITVVPAGSGGLSNTASATTTTTETTVVNNTDTEETVVVPAEGSSGPDLTVTKTANAESVTVGNNVTYTIVVANVGDEAATSVSIVDQLPDGVTFVSADSLAATCNEDGDVYCNLEALAPDSSVSVTIVVTATAVGEPTNTATAGAEAADPTPGNNTSAASITVLPVLEEVPPPTPGPGTADLSLTKTAAPFVVNGGSFSYTLVVANKGPDPATGVVLTDKLPGGVSFGSASASQGSCSGGGTVSCSLGTIKAKSSATLTIGVTATSPGITINEAKVAGAETDPNPGDNQAFATTRISPRIDLGISATVTPEAVRSGGELTYHIVVTNGGPDTAEGALVPLRIPDGATFVSVKPSQGICIPDGTVLCFLGRIAAGGSAAVDLVLRAGASGDLVLAPTVSSDGGTDSKSGNNATSITGTVAQPFDLRLEMRSTPARIKTGDWITYTITATNLGPGAATAVRVVDQLPETVAYLSCETTQGECTSSAFLRVTAGRLVEARLGRLGPGDSGQITILGRATGPGTATNSAAVSGGGEDPVLSGNNETTAQTPVGRNQIPPPADVPPPVFNENVDVAPKTGTIRFRRPGSNVFEILTGGEQLPLGTEFDTTNGTMILTSATDTAGTVQTAEFWDGFFIVTQTVVKQTTAVTDLALTRGAFSSCPSTRRFASLDQKPPKKNPPKGKGQPKGKKTSTQRKLWGRGDGKFRTKGRYSSAAIRGTYWLTADRCDGTLTSVREGVVVVRDFVRRKSITLRAGKSYLARPKR